MKRTNKRQAWHLFYAICCLVYVTWVGYQGTFDLGRVYRQYQRIGDQMETGRIQAAALQELAEECKSIPAMQSAAESSEEHGLTDKPDDHECKSFPPGLVESRESAIRERLAERHSRAFKKLLLFCIFFVVIFLMLPPLFVYGLALGIVRVFKNIKIVRKE